MQSLISTLKNDPVRQFAFLALGITLARIIALFFSDIDLGPDETQYWFWSQTPAFGYFSKPPMIAWAIAVTTSIFGNAEWAVRASAPFFHLITASFIFLATRSRYDEQSALWAGLIWLTLPSATLSSMVISTDALLLSFWSASLYLFLRLTSTKEQTSRKASMLAAFLGAAIGLGFLSKYAMIYFLIGVTGSIILAGMRLSWRNAAIAATVGLLVLTPNLLWNANHGFQTLSHTAANANWQGDLYHPIALIEFLLAQFAVFGPITFALFIAGLVTFNKKLKSAAEKKGTDLALLCFAVPPIVIVAIQAFISRAHANWAAAAFPAATILVAGWAMRARKTTFLKGAVLINIIASLVFMAAATNFSLVDRVGLSEVVKRVRGWEQQGNYIAQLSTTYDAVMVDDREVMGGVLYYARTSDIPVVAWNSNSRIDHHYEAFHSFRPTKYQRLLYVTPHSDAIAVRNQFDTIKHIGETTADLKMGRYRRLYLFELDGYRYLRGDLLDEDEPL